VTSSVIKTSSGRAYNRQRQKSNGQPAIRLETTIFDLCHERYNNLAEMARAMGDIGEPGLPGKTRHTAYQREIYHRDS